MSYCIYAQQQLFSNPQYSFASFTGAGFVASAHAITILNGMACWQPAFILTRLSVGSVSHAYFMSLSSSLQRLTTGLIVPPVELVFTPHSLWPLPRSTNLTKSYRALQIAVLDSSFNPPTVAHLALANAQRPSYQAEENHQGADESLDYDAKLLLLSVRNADKKLKPTDATYVQRLEMMIEFAKDVATRDQNDDPEEPSNVAVAIIDEPGFAGKSRLLQTFLRDRLSLQQPQLTFLLGYDTLERLFSPRYYGPPKSEPREDSEKQDATSHMYAALRKFFAHPPEGDGSRVVCARRSPSSYPQAPPNTSSLTSQLSLTSTIHDFYTSQSLPSECVKMIDIGEDVWSVSSSAARAAIDKGDDGWKAMVSDNVREYILKEGLYT